MRKYANISTSHTRVPLGEILLSSFHPRSTAHILMLVSVVFAVYHYSISSGPCCSQKTTFPGLYAAAPPPSSPSAFPPTPLGREEVARWLMSLGSNVPLCNMKPWVWKKAREAPSGFYFSFLLVTFLLFRQTSISFRVVSTPDLSSGVDASNHAGDPCQELTASHTVSKC